MQNSRQRSRPPQDDADHCWSVETIRPAGGADHRRLSEIIFRPHEVVLKQSRRHLAGGVELTQEADMRRLVFVIALIAVASAGISASFAAVQHARSLTFAERFAPALELMAKQ